MNNKGFTLIEIVVVIALIAIFAGIFTINTTSILNSQNETNEQQVYTDLENAMDAWLHANRDVLTDIPTDGTPKPFQTNILIEEGYLKSSDGIPSTIKVYKDENGVITFLIEGSNL